MVLRGSPQHHQPEERQPLPPGLQRVLAPGHPLGVHPRRSASAVCLVLWFRRCQEEEQRSSSDVHSVPSYNDRRFNSRRCCRASARRFHIY